MNQVDSDRHDSYISMADSSKKDTVEMPPWSKIAHLTEWVAELERARNHFARASYLQNKSADDKKRVRSTSCNQGTIGRIGQAQRAMESC